MHGSRKAGMRQRVSSFVAMIRSAILAGLVMLLMLAPRISHAQGTITIYSSTDTDAMTAILEGFRAANPEVSVVYREFLTREMFEDVVAGRAQEADVIISSSMDLQVDLVNRGLARPFLSPLTNSLPDWAKWRNELFGFTYEPVAVLYNKAAFDGRALPRTRSDLASAIRDDPEFFLGRIGSYDIRVSGAGYLFATQDMQRGYQFWRLVESFGRSALKTYCCTNEIFNGVASGELVFAYNVIGSYAIESARRDQRVGVYTFDDYALVMSRSAFIPKAAPNPEGGIAFITYLLSPEGQRLMDESSALIPIAAAQGSETATLEAFGKREAMMPIRLGPGLIAYLDTMKRNRVIDDWEATVSPVGSR